MFRLNTIRWLHFSEEKRRVCCISVILPSSQCWQVGGCRRGKQSHAHCKSGLFCRNQGRDATVPAGVRFVISLVLLKAISTSRPGGREAQRHGLCHCVGGWRQSCAQTGAHTQYAIRYSVPWAVNHSSQVTLNATRCSSRIYSGRLKTWSAKTRMKRWGCSLSCGAHLLEHTLLQIVASQAASSESHVAFNLQA